MLVPQLQALALLDFAFRDPEVNFSEGQKLVDNVNRNLVREEEFWIATVGELTTSLAIKLIEHPESPLPIKFTWADKTAIYNSGDGNASFYIVDNSEERPWTLEPDIKIDVAKLNVQNLFHFTETIINATMDIEDGKIPVPNIFTGKLIVGRSPDDKGKWYLQSTESGLFQSLVSGFTIKTDLGVDFPTQIPDDFRVPC
ncbi:hypothetical protein FHETE_6865 [Fusarium heterosporum]|uniref:Uncharacterized protein n=1 Tax=Fusarium heterosporum TaxID=42747 RepID=A0A8H5T3L1_FUSHE|nr:hypothetical protein FHETE_6865 [Fusarium heterosporum]